MSDEKHDVPFELPPIEDMIPDEEEMQQRIWIDILLREEKDLDEAIKEIIKRSNQLSAAMITAHDIISSFIHANKTEAHKRIERVTRCIWTWLLANRVNAGVEGKTDASDKTDEEGGEA